MVSEGFLKSVLVVSDTMAAAFRFESENTIPTFLERGRRFDAVTALEDTGQYAVFHDLATGLMFICPSDRLLELTGRFARKR